MIDLTKPSEQIHADLGWKRLSKPWAKLEILLGLSSLAIGVVFLATWATNLSAAQLVRARPTAQHCCDILDGLPGVNAAAGFALFVLGGYLALAGHRSHLYQAQLQLTAYWIEQMHRFEDIPQEGSSHVP